MTDLKLFGTRAISTSVARAVGVDHGESPEQPLRSSHLSGNSNRLRNRCGHGISGNVIIPSPGIKVINLVTLKSREEAKNPWPIMLKAILAIFISLHQNITTEIWRSIKHHLGKVNDIGRMLHHVHFNDTQLVVVPKHFRNPKTVDFLGDAPISQPIICVAFVGIRIIMAEDLNGRPSVGFPNVTVRAATKVLVDLYAFTCLSKISSNSGFTVRTSQHGNLPGIRLFGRG